MKRPDLASACAFSLLTGALAAPVSAGTIYGTVVEHGSPASTHLILMCGNLKVESDTNRGGSYRLTIDARGRCRLRVTGMPAPGELVFVYDEPTRYDYEVQSVGGVTKIVRR